MSNATIKELSAQLAAKACSSVELAQEFINKINDLRDFKTILSDQFIKKECNLLKFNENQLLKESLEDLEYK